MDVSDTLSDGSPERGADTESLLCEAVKAGRNDEAIGIIENTISGSKPIDDMLCAGLLCAVTYSNTSMVRDLLREGANPEGEGNKSLLFAAIESDDPGIPELLLEAGADVNAVDEEGRSVLMAAARSGRHEMVTMLIAREADVNLRSKYGSWTPLHTACEGGHRGVVEKLLEAGAPLNARLLNGMTPLHCAAQRGTFDIIEYLLQRKDISCHARDTFGRTPFLLALQSRNKAAIELLAKTYATSNETATGASHGFNATIIDFGNFHGHNKLRKVTIHDLLYKNGSIRPRNDAIKVYPDDDNCKFRWIHLPANNREWVDHALRKALIEVGNEDPSSFLLAERSLTQSHDGPYAHSRYMRAQSQTFEMTPAIAAKSSHTTQADLAADAGDGPEKPSRRSHTPRASMIYTYMPYLHFETEDRLQEMRRAIERSRNSTSQGLKRSAMTNDEMLIMGYSANKALHIRRTLDQVLHPNLHLEPKRPHDSYQERSWTINHAEMEAGGAKLFIVDQLWMWILGERLVITAFPQRWSQPKNEPYNVLDAVIQEINTPRQYPRTAFDLAGCITQQCTSSQAEIEMLDAMEQSISDAVMEESRLFDDFNAASAEATRWLHSARKNTPSSPDRGKSRVGRRKANAGAAVDDGTQDPDISEQRPSLFIDNLLEIGSEIDLMNDVRGIRKDLGVIARVVEEQRNVLVELESAIKKTTGSHIHEDDFREQIQSVDTNVRDLERLDRNAENIYKSITDLLDFKQKHANALGVRFARDQAAELASQWPTIVFTIVTIIFLPLSFIATMFTVNIKELPHEPGESEPSLPLSFVLKYLLGIGLTISIPLIIMVLSFNLIKDLVWVAKRRLTLKVNDRRVARDRSARSSDGVHHQKDFSALEAAIDEDAVSVRSRRSFHRG